MRAPRTPDAVRLWNSRTSVAAKRIALPLRVASRTSSSSVSRETPISRSSEPSSKRIASLPAARMLAKASIELRRTSPLAVANMTWSLPHSPSSSGKRQDGRDGLALGQRQQVHHRPAARLRRAFGQAPHLQAIGLAVGREEQDRIVGRGHEQFGDRILVLGRHAGAALAAARLGAEGLERRALDIAAEGHGHDHLLALDQSLVLDPVPGGRDLGHARRRIGLDDLLELLAHHRVELRPGRRGFRAARRSRRRACAARRRSRRGRARSGDGAAARGSRGPGRRRGCRCRRRISFSTASTRAI